VTDVDFLYVFVFVFVFVLVLHTDGVVVSHVFPAADIGMMALSISVAIVHGAIVLLLETKMATMTMTVVRINEMHHGPPSTPLSDSRLREGKGEGNERKGYGRHCGRWW
jgi:hypothetical protein